MLLASFFPAGRPRAALLAAALAALAPVDALCAGDEGVPTTASQYLSAWTFKDYATMRALSSDDTRSALPESRFFAAAAALPQPIREPGITKHGQRPGGAPGDEFIYFTFPPTDDRVQLTRGSLLLENGRIVHPELLATAARLEPQAAPVAATPASTGTVAVAPAAQAAAGVAAPVAPAAITIDGESVETIIEKSSAATRAAETLVADVDINGSLAGTVVGETAHLEYKAPGKFRLKSASFNVTNDGSRTTIYLPTANVYMNLSELGGQLGGQMELLPGMGPGGIDDLKAKYAMRLVEKVTINQQAAYRIELKPPTGALGSLAGNLGGGIGAALSGGGKMSLWIDCKTFLPVKAQLQGVTATYRNVQVNTAKIDDSQFEFRAPRGAQALSLGGLLGGGMGSVGE